MIGHQGTLHQVWDVGAEVKVGFLKLRVVDGPIRNSDHYLPDIYVLESAKGVRYEFTPHNGLQRLD